MMTQIVSAARWGAVQNLQARRANPSNQTFDVDVYDRAIDYVLSGKRSDDPFLAHNAFRNARHSLHRERKHPLRGGVKALEVGLGGGRVSRPYEEGSRPDHTYMQSLGADPETLLSDRQETQNFRPEGLRAIRHAEKVWDDWTEGRAIAETALALAISTRQIKKIRNRIKARALMLAGSA